MNKKRLLSLILIMTMVLSATVNFDAASRPEKVKGVTTASIGKKTVTLKWKKAKRAKYYQIYRITKTYRPHGKTKYKYKKVGATKKRTFKIKNLKPGKRYKFRLRAMRGKKKGKFSKIKVVTTKKAKPSMRYSYDIKFFNQPYNDLEVGMFIKTNNPDYENFIVEFYKSGKEVETSTFIGLDFFDLPKSNEDYWKVNGGYVKALGIQTSGEITVKIKEFPKGKKYFDYYSGCSFKTKTIGKISVLDYSKNKQDWINSIISKTCNESMTKKEKMTAITNHLYSISKYVKNYIDRSGDIDYLVRVTDWGIPPWKTNEWDSCSSPAILEEFGNSIGYKLHSMYGDYPIGSDNWKQYHWLAKAEDGSLFGFCRESDTNCFANIHSRDDVPKVNCLTYNKYYICH